MSAQHVSEDRLIDLSRGLLPPDERARTLAHVSACAACEEKFREICGAAAKLAVAESLPTLTARRRRVVRISIAATAATLLIAVLGAWVLRRNPAPSDAEAWLPVESERVMFRTLPGSDENALFLQAVEAYSAHDARRVVELLGDRRIPPEYDFLRLLLASAYVRESSYERALTVLDALDIDSLPQPYRDRARWERYLALNRSAKAEEALSVLSELASRPGEFQARARQALGRAPAVRGE
jgi:hypothetical protein